MAVEPIQLLGFQAHRLSCAGGAAEVITELGGLVRSIRLQDSRRPGATVGPSRELLAPDSPQDLAANPWFRGRILFPFNDRIPQGTYQWNGRSLQLPINSQSDGSALHGLIYDQPSDVVSSSSDDDESHLRLSFQISRERFPGYPFDVRLDSAYVLRRDSFSLELAATNTGREAAPIAFGWHPYFTLGEPVDSLTLRADCAAFIPVDDALLPTGGPRPVDGTEFDFRRGRRIGESRLDVALTAPPDGRLRLSSAVETVELTLRGAAFRYFQLFTHPDRASIAIEPVTAATNSFNLPELGLRILRPGEVLSGRLTVARYAMAD